ncbi:MAG: hypothetical protein WKF34_12565 [Pyrinomonadaceae bacterium]
MKHRFTLPIILFVFLFAILGCGLADRVQKEMGGSSGTNTDTSPAANQPTDPAIDIQKTGVAECDEVVDMVTAFAAHPDDNFAVRYGKSLIVDQIKDSIKKSVEENGRDKVELAKDCTVAKTELKRAMNQWENKNANQ